MWAQQGHDGVAVCSRYELLKAALDGLFDEAHLGAIRYGTNHLVNTFNALELITTKQAKYSADREVRAFLTVYDPLAVGNRHFDLNNVPHPAPLDVNPRHSWVPDCKRRRINLRSLITDVVISPWAEPDAVEKIKLRVKCKGFPGSARLSDLTEATTPTIEEFRRFRPVAATRVPEPEIADETQASNEELERFRQVLSTLPESRVRFLYRQRWETAGQIHGVFRSSPTFSSSKGLCRILDTRKRQRVDVG
jgi:hypothetical protein